MAIIKAINSKSKVDKIIDYITQEEKTEEKLISGINCNPCTVKVEMEVTKLYFGKTGGRQYKHFVQSFAPGEVSPQIAHEIGLELSKEWDKFEVLLATHIDKGHIHNHFVINSVGFEDGKKFQQSKKDLENLKQRNNELCIGHGLSVAEKGDKITTYNYHKYSVIEQGLKEQGKSYIVDMAKDIKTALKSAENKKEFISELKEDMGYEVNWTDTRKHITFINKDGKKIRNTNLEKTLKDESFSKENIEKRFIENKEQLVNLFEGKDKIKYTHTKDQVEKSKEIALKYKKLAEDNKEYIDLKIQITQIDRTSEQIEKLQAKTFGFLDRSGKKNNAEEISVLKEKKKQLLSNLDVHFGMKLEKAKEHVEKEKNPKEDIKKNDTNMSLRDIEVKIIKNKRCMDLIQDYIKYKSAYVEYKQKTGIKTKESIEFVRIYNALKNLGLDNETRIVEFKDNFEEMQKKLEKSKEEIPKEKTIQNIELNNDISNMLKIKNEIDFKNKKAEVENNKTENIEHETPKARNGIKAEIRGIRENREVQINTVKKKKNKELER